MDLPGLQIMDIVFPLAQTQGLWEVSLNERNRGYAAPFLSISASWHKFLNPRSFYPSCCLFVGIQGNL